ncbi:MAG: FkbM family methyltransferase [Burkholderiales bacterium]|nr:FkbM family methyltransferase [Burkholderiales bacterium]
MLIINRNDWDEFDGQRFGVGTDLREFGTYAQAELDALALIIAQLPADGVVLDVGANLGVHSLWFSQLVGPRGRVLAFEAQRIVFQMLMGNLALNSIENVYARNVAVGADIGSMRMPVLDYGSRRNFGGLELSLHSASTSLDKTVSEIVEVVTLDSLALEQVDFIKIDVEGMEQDVLAGARDTLARHRPFLQAEWLGRDAGALPRALLGEYGYRVFQYGMNLLCLPAEQTRITLAGLPEITLDMLAQAHANS